MSGLIVREFDDETVILDPESDRVHRLNATASLIWKMHTSGSSQEAIAKALANQFDIGENQAQTDVAEAISRFEAMALLKQFAGERHGSQ